MAFNDKPSKARTSSRHMTLAGKRDEFTMDDIKACVQSAGLKRGCVETINAEVLVVVVRWRDYLDASRVSPEQRNAMQAVLRIHFDETHTVQSQVQTSPQM